MSSVQVPRPAGKITVSFASTVAVRAFVAQTGQKLIILAYHTRTIVGFLLFARGAFSLQAVRMFVGNINTDILSGITVSGDLIAAPSAAPSCGLNGVPQPLVSGHTLTGIGTKPFPTFWQDNRTCRAAPLCSQIKIGATCHVYRTAVSTAIR